MTPLLHSLPPTDSVQRISTATALYYRQLDGTPPLALQLVVWLEPLPSSMQRFLYGLGMRHCLSLPEFLRYVLTKRGYSLYAFLEGHLAAPDLAEWMRQESAPQGQSRGNSVEVDSAVV